MTKEQIQEEYTKLLNKKIKDEEEIIKKAKADGTWKAGLDFNEHLFDDLEKEFREKTKLLKSMFQNHVS